MSIYSRMSKAEVIEDETHQTSSPNTAADDDDSKNQSATIITPAKSENHQQPQKSDQDDSEFVTIKLKDLMEEVDLVAECSEFVCQMRRFLEKGEPMPKALIHAAVLNKALHKLDPTTPVLVTDRHLLPREQEKSLASVVFPSHSITAGTQTGESDSGAGATDTMTIEEEEAETPASAGGNGPNENKNISELGDDGGQRLRRHREKATKLATKFAKHVLQPPKKRPPGTKEGDHAGSNVLIRYLKKMKGGQKSPPYEAPVEALQSFLVSFVGMLCLTSIDFFLIRETRNTLVIGSFGATAVLTFCAIYSPLAQPRNLIAGHTISAVIGVGCQYSLGEHYPWLAGALAVSLAIAVMSLTNTVHPPGGATALIAVYSADDIHTMGLWYVLIPVVLGALILLIVALVGNNLFPSRRYPLNWY